MKRRLVVSLVGLAISFALPTYAQEKDLADPQTTQKILALGKAFDEAHSEQRCHRCCHAIHARRGSCYNRGADHWSASHSEILYRPVPVVAP